MKTLTFVFLVTILVAGIAMSLIGDLFWLAIVLGFALVSLLFFWILLGTLGVPKPNPHNTPAGDPTRFGGGSNF